jgi:hypothetical protein
MFARAVMLPVQYDKIAMKSCKVKTISARKYAAAVLRLIRDGMRERRRAAPLRLALGERGVTGAA